MMSAISLFFACLFRLLCSLFLSHNSWFFHLLLHKLDFDLIYRFYLHFRLDLFLNLHFFNFLFRLGIELSEHIDLDILFAFEDCLHDFDIFIAEDGDIIIVLIEEGDVECVRADVELFCDKVDDVLIDKVTGVEFGFFFIFENKLHS
jgi:hypothetical protein